MTNVRLYMEALIIDRKLDSREAVSSKVRYYRCKPSSPPFHGHSRRSSTHGWAAASISILTLARRSLRLMIRSASWNDHILDISCFVWHTLVTMVLICSMTSTFRNLICPFNPPNLGAFSYRKMACLTALLLIITCINVSSGALHTNDDKTETIGWQSDPNGRGTFTLVSSCVLTLIICVYSAMHLNVTPHGGSGLQFWWRNIRWALAGIFAPDLVVFITWKQYLSARAIVKRSQNEIHLDGITSPGKIQENISAP